jgi:hypothetical protein
MMPRWWYAAAAAVLLQYAPAASAGEPLIRFELRGQTVEAAPLAVSKDKAFMLARDGQLLQFPPSEAQSAAQVAGGFHSFSQAEIRGQLLREFGGRYEVSGVGHYLVVHPAGKRDEWAPRFEQLYRSFVHFFSARGWQLHKPQFPLVAVVFPRQADFWEHAASDGLRPHPGILGYYSPVTNRILMYDASPRGSRGDWATNAETIIHEAAHQTAFNTGVHTRFGDSPRWLVEGLGTLFEARGVWQSRTYPHQPDRINRARLASWQAYNKTRRASGTMAQLVASDRIFSADPDGAYAEAWALSFFLLETMPKQYLELLSRAANRPTFSDYAGPQRLQDFTQIFGSDLTMLEARLQRFLAGLK